MRRIFLITLALTWGAPWVSANIIQFSGLITQSTSDGTGPAVNNPALNNIEDGDLYSVSIQFVGSVMSAGTYDLTGGTLVFTDLAGGESEMAFNTISLTVAPDGGFFDISLLGCLTTGSGCAFSNQLDANFRILSTSLNLQNVTAQPIPALTPLDLLEDDGITDIQGSVGTYTYAPEPSPAFLCIAALLLFCGLSTRASRSHGQP